MRYLTNLILLVGEYSPYMERVRALPSLSDGLDIRLVGCYKDGWDRDLPYQVHHYTAATNAPRRCLLSCQMLGYRYAGLQQHECWCGNEVGKHGQVDDKQCSAQCSAVRQGLLSTILTSAESKADAERQQPSACGEGFLNSVYDNQHPETRDSYQLNLVAPAGVKYVKGREGESCDAACEREGGGEYGRCDERYFPLIHRSCAALSKVLGEECRLCVDEEEPERGFATPAYDKVKQQCLLSRARYHRCNWQPPQGLIRACTCVQ